jgi:hypothetical protein
VQDVASYPNRQIAHRYLEAARDGPVVRATASILQPSVLHDGVQLDDSFVQGVAQRGIGNRVIRPHPSRLELQSASPTTP